MINSDNIVKENIKVNPNWLKTFDPSYRILIIGGYGSG